jgi:type I restriction enzyme R subunit
MAPGFGYADYVLFIDGLAVGALEAKPEGYPLIGVEPQVRRYSDGLPAELKAPHRPLPFLYLSTGVETRFTNLLDPRHRSRPVFSVHRPETLAEWLQAEPLEQWLAGRAAGTAAAEAVRGFGTGPSTLRARLRRMPPVHVPNLWPNKVEALQNLERSLAEDHPRALIQMATGSGKTMLAVTALYRLIKFGGARRALFLVDRSNLGEQAEKSSPTTGPPTTTASSRSCTTSSGSPRIRSAPPRRSSSPRSSGSTRC